MRRRSIVQLGLVATHVLMAPVLSASLVSAEDLTGSDRCLCAPIQATVLVEAGEQVELQNQQAQQATAEQIENFKKAFSVCLEAKNYMVKY